jgi:hypothetical protein
MKKIIKYRLIGNGRRRNISIPCERNNANADAVPGKNVYASGKYLCIIWKYAYAMWENAGASGKNACESRKYIYLNGENAREYGK